MTAVGANQLKMADCPEFAMSLIVIYIVRVILHIKTCTQPCTHHGSRIIPLSNLELVYFYSHWCMSMARSCQNIIFLWPSLIGIDHVYYWLSRANIVLIFGVFARTALPVKCSVDVIIIVLAIVFAVRSQWRSGYEDGLNLLHRIAKLTTRRQRAGSKCTTMGRPFDCAMQLLEGDYQQAISGAPWFNVKSTETLLTARGHMSGMTALEIAITTSEQVVDSELVQLLRGWESSPLAIPPPTCQLSTASLVFNPQLTPFQSFLARGVRDLLHDTTIHSVAYQVLGYLTPMGGGTLENLGFWYKIP